MDKTKKIIYFNNCWFTNVGEAFIDIGSFQVLHNVFPYAQIACVSDMTNYYYNEVTSREGNSLIQNEDSMNTISDYYKYLSCDYIVLSGMFASRLFIKTMGRTIVDTLVEKGAKVIFLGLGGEEYSKKEREIFSEYLSDINPMLVMTRDMITYEYYKDICNCIPGIDCAFWTKDAFNPKGFTDECYDVVTFNRSAEPKDIDLNNRIIRPWHMQYSMKRKDCKKGLMVSDCPYDYLTIYANARRVYTDLVHATIISLMYGTPVKYWYFDERSKAFDAVDGLENKDGWLAVDSASLEKQKKLIEKEIILKLPVSER